MYDSTNQITRNYGYELDTQLINNLETTRTGYSYENTLTYDAAGNPVTSLHDHSTAANDHLECYQFEGRSNLRYAFTDNVPTSGTYSCTGAAQSGTLGYAKTFTTDEIGNFSDSGGGTSYGPAGAYTYPASGTSSVRPHAVTTTSNGYSFTYDYRGNMKSRTLSGTATNYTWDRFNRLMTAIRAGTTLASNIYYPGGERALLKDPDGVRLYIGDIAEIIVDNGGTATYKRNYTQADRSIAVRTQTGATNNVDFLITDIRGSVGATILGASGGPVLSEQWYSPYGDRRGAGTISNVTTREYIGQHRDTHTGLNYLNNRYYMANVGAFANVDPLVVKTGEPFLYGSGNPIALKDADGLCTTEACREGKKPQNYPGCGSYAKGAQAMCYMRDEMLKNREHEYVQDERRSNYPCLFCEKDDYHRHLMNMKKLEPLLGEDNPWDHKRAIISMFGANSSSDFLNLGDQLGVG